MTNNKLRECPFCGQHGVHEKFSNGINESFSISCGTHRCYIKVPQNFKTKAEAITAWNYRAESTAPLLARIEELEAAAGKT